MKLGLYAKQPLLVLLLESLSILKSHSKPVPNTAQESLRHIIAFSPRVIGYFPPSFTLNRNDWGEVLQINKDGGDSQSVVVKPPKMKSAVV